MNFSNQLTHYRKLAGLTQEQIAEKCNVTRQAVAKWESGASLPDIYMILKLADIFSVTIDELLNHSAINKTNANSNMDKDTGHKLWGKVCEILKEDMSEISYTTWIQPLKLEEVDEEKKQVRIMCDSDFIVNIVNKRHLKKMRSLVEKIFGDNYSIVVYNYS